MSTKQQDKFNFFIPLNFEKGSKPSDEMKFKGICSSATEDSDGETLYPSGFDFQPLMEKGFINWNHQTGKTSSAIIGRPTKAAIINNGKDFYIEGVLYKSLDEAKKVYALAQALEEDGDPSRKLGFSIEGRATQRDILNPKKVLKAEITGVAITSSPKNSNTLLSIMKGNYEEAFIKSVDIESLVSEYKNWVTEDGHRKKDSHYGTEGSVKEFLENYHEDNIDMTQELQEALQKSEVECDHKNLKDGKCPDCGFVEKAMTAEEGVNTTSVEDVEHNPKDIVNKSVVYQQLISRYDVDNIEKAKEIFSFIETVNNKLYNNTMEITKEALQKSFDLLDSSINLQKSEDKDKEDILEKKEEKEESKEEKKEEPKVEEAEKSETKEEEVKKSDDEDDSEEMEKAISYAKDNLSKGLSKDENIEDCIRKGISLIVSSTAVDRVISEAEALAENGGDIEKLSSIVSEKVEKSFKDLNEKIDAKFDALIKSFSEFKMPTFDLTSTLQKSEVEEIIKEQEFDLSPVEDLIKSQTEGLNEKFSSMGQILQNIVSNNELVKSQMEELVLENTSLREKVGVIEKSSQGRKSATTLKEVERFEKSNIDNSDTYSISNSSDLKDLNNRLFAEWEILKSKGRTDNALEKAIQDLEIAKFVDPAFLPRLKAMGISVVK